MRASISVSFLHRLVFSKDNNMITRKDLRNVAIIAHVDHGKTTLVDQLLRSSNIFRSNEQVVDRVMDSNNLERERGITILAKNTAVIYKGTKINIIDTPGHADFGGEVERVLSMIDGVLLVVDAIEGCMPQTRYVLKKALELNKKPLIVINKVDRDGSSLQKVIDEIMELFLELGATEDQFDFKIIYASAKQGWASDKPDQRGTDMQPLFEAIIKHIPAPVGFVDKGLQVLVCNIDYDEYIGRIGIGRIVRGKINLGQTAHIARRDGTSTQFKVTKLYEFEGLRRVEVMTSKMGDIIALSGIANINIGETICETGNIEALPFVDIDEPTISMVFSVNNSPFAGREGKFVTSRHLRARLYKEIETNVSMRIEDTDSADSFKIYGRGELHFSILIESMRREGYEFSVSRPKVILKNIDGKSFEPMERVIIDVPDSYVGTIITSISGRKGELKLMTTDNRGSTRLEFSMPSRGLIGYRNEMLTSTNGNAVLNHIFDGYKPHKGAINERVCGSVVVHEDGVTTAYGLYNAQERSTLFISDGLLVYEGMIVGQNSREEDLVVNVCKKKQLTNNRASGSEEALKLITPTFLSLEQCLSFIADDELVEVTPKSIRLRKKILNKELRKRAHHEE